MKKKRVISIICVISDLILLGIFIRFIPSFFRNTVGYDVIEDEDWFGEMESQIQYRFGAGCCELTFILLKMIFFVIGQFRLLKSSARIQMVLCIILHIIIGVLGLMYYFRFADGPFFLYLIESITSE